MQKLPSQLTIISRDAGLYAALLAERNLPDLNIVAIAESAENVDLNQVEILLSEPNIAAQIVPECSNLQWLQSTWAGNTPLLQLAKSDYTLTGVKGVFGAAMREYVFAYLLYFERNIETFKHAASLPVKNAKSDFWIQPSVGTLKGKRLGILGAGSIASELVNLARMFEMSVVGLNRSGLSDIHFDALFVSEDVYTFASELDYLVCILPDTPQTKHIIDATFLSHLPSQCILINAGRGNSIDDSALINALNNQKLKAAVLDVFQQEPLPNDHPYWHMDTVYVTQHTAAITPPKAVIDIFSENYTLWRNKQTLNYQIDFTRGY